MDTHEWLARPKRIDWDIKGAFFAFHPFEVSLIAAALATFYQVRGGKLNPISAEVFDHLDMQFGQLDGEYPYPSERTIKVFEKK